MKKNRKQTALAKCVLATIMAMGMMGYTTVWAEDTVTPTPSPIDKTVAKDKNGPGHIYDATYVTDGWSRKYFWTDLGHAQVQIGSGEKIELFTPFIYHTKNDQWKNGGNSWSPVHEGDNSEMECRESMSNITVGEFDRIIKSLYTNDITMAKTIYGEAGQAGLKDTVIKEVRATPGQGKTVNTYELVRANDKVLAAAIVDTDTKITGNELTFADGKLTSKITDNADGTFVSSVNGIASQEWVQEKIAEIPSIIDTNSITTVQNDGNGYVTVTGGQGDDGDYNYIVGFNEEKLIETIQANDKDTITTAESGHEIITVENNLTDTDKKNYKIGINEEALKGFIKDNTQDTNTITTVQDDKNGYVTVTEAPDPNQSGNHAYTVSFNEQKLNAAIEAQDRYVNGGSIGADGKITLNVRNGEGEDVKLDGQLKDAQLTEIERDKAAGTATLVVKDGYTNEEVRRLTIDDIASKAQNDKEHAEFREHFSMLFIVLTTSAAALTRLAPVLPLSQRCTRWISIPMTN